MCTYCILHLQLLNMYAGTKSDMFDFWGQMIQVFYIFFKLYFLL